MFIPAYCSMSYLLDVAKRNPTIDFIDPDTINSSKSHWELLELIFNGLHIYTDVTNEKIDEANPYIKHLKKSNRITSASEIFGQIRINADEYFSNHQKGCGVYMLSSTFTKEMVSSYEIKSGYHFLLPSSTSNHLFEEQLESFKPDEHKEWAFAKRFLEPHHSLIIADPYLFKESGVKSCINLLEQTLSNKLITGYHISLLGSNSSRKKLDDLTIKVIKQSVDRIKKAIEQIIPNSVVEFHIYNGEDFHDRYIISNNSFIFSGTGLDIIKGLDRVNKDSTWIAFKPFKKIAGGKFFYKVMLEKLQMLEGWIVKTEQKTTTNPLFRMIRGHIG